MASQKRRVKQIGAIMKKSWDILAAFPYMNANEIYISQCHRLGHFQQGFSRGIIVNFHWYVDLTEMINQRQYLPPSIYVRHDYPKEWENLRRQLHSIFKLAKSKEQCKDNSSFYKERLVCNGKMFTTAPRKNSKELPQNLQPRNALEKQNKSVFCFLGSHSLLSSLHKPPFQLDGTQYSCTEQYIQCPKVQLFNNDLTHHRIMRDRSLQN